MKISLSPEVERLIAEKVKSGRYGSADEVVREGLGLLQERERQRIAPPNVSCDLVDAFEDIARAQPDSEWEKVPADLSKNLDQYLYSKQKTS